MAPEDRPGMDEIVLIAVIEGEHGKRPRRRDLAFQPQNGLVQGNEIVTFPNDMLEDCVEEMWGDLQPGIRGKAVLCHAIRPHMVQHEYCTHPAQHRAQCLRCPRIIQDIKTCFKNGGHRHAKNR